VSRFFIVLLTLSLSAQNALTPEEERGRQIYESGTSPSGSSIWATPVGGDRVAGSILRCINCHGQDGRGQPEGGVVPSNITWDALTKPYDVERADGSSHPAYTERLLQRAVTMGIDSAGSTLNSAMPRFELSTVDAADLIAYIKRLGHTIDPGLTADAVRLGVILQPFSQTEKSVHRMRQSFLDYFARVNAQGGVFGRRIELIFAELPENRLHRVAAVRDFVRNEKIFAAMGDFRGTESELATVMQETGTPAIAVFAPFPDTSFPPNGYVFYLDGGVKDEIDALLSFASQHLPEKEVDTAIPSSEREGVPQAVNWIQTRLAESGGRLEGPFDLEFWLRPDLPADSKKVFLIPGSLANFESDMHPAPNAQVFVAAGAATTWDRAAASATIVTESMKLAGRRLSRATLLRAMEQVQDDRTGLGYGPSRRVGSHSVRILKLDSQSGNLILVATWKGQ
jgi:mono/diheme cytochrome c family protein